MRRSLPAIAAFVLAASAALSAHAAAPNLVGNGDFEGGNSGFMSDYAFSPGGNSTEGQYTVRFNPNPWNGLFISAADHTSGSGLMYVGNGSPVDGAVVWRSGVIGVAQNTDYFFEAFVMNVCCSSTFPGNTPSILEFSVAGLAIESLGTATTDIALAGTWEGLSKSWNSGANTSVVLSLINRNTARGGNDFAIDDVFLGTTSTVTPVPEPETYVLMMAGLAAVAFAPPPLPPWLPVAQREPPETTSRSPVIQRDSSEARNTATPAMSSGWPKRPSGVSATIRFSKSLPMMPALCVPSVSTPPGAMALTRILRGPSSLARSRVIASSAPLVAR